MPGKSDYGAFNPPHQSDQRRHKWTSNQRRGCKHLCSKPVPGLWLWMSGEAVQYQTPPSLPVLGCQGDNVTTERDYCEMQSIFIQSWLTQTRHAQSLIHVRTWSMFASTCAIAQMWILCCRRLSDKGVSRLKWFNQIFADKCVGDCGEMGGNKAAKWKARHSVTYRTCSPQTKWLNSTNGLPSVQLDVIPVGPLYYSELTNDSATHYRKCPMAWDSKWFHYASWCRTGMMKCWFLSFVKHGAILRDERNCETLVMFLDVPLGLLPGLLVPNSSQFL